MKTAKQLMDLAERGRKFIARPANHAQWFRIENADGGDNDRAELYIYGAIGDFWGDDDVTPAAFTRALRGVTASALDLHINSPGGYVFDGIAIHAALLNHAATVDVHIDGVAASAASFVAMAGDSITIEKPAKMMIHDAAALTIGNADDHREAADLLDELSDTIAGIYADRAGGTVEQWRDAMKVETWYGSAAAVEAGLADRVANDSADQASNKTPAGAVASAGGSSRFAAVAVAGGTPAPANARGSQTPQQGRNSGMTIDEIMAAMRAITDGAKGRNMTDEEVKRYEALEVDLATQRTAQIRERQTAYETPVTDNIAAAVHVSPAKEDDGLERAFENYLRTGRANADIAELRVTNSQSAGTESEGGFTVPDGFRQKLVDKMKAYGGLAAAVESFPTETGNPIEYPTVDDTSNEGTITAENAAITGGADLVFGSVNLGAFKYTSAGASNQPLKVSVELLQDSAFDVAGLVASKLGTRIARKQAKDWVTGAGTTLPFGIAHSGLTPDGVLATSNTITYDDLLEIETALDPAYEQNAQWAMSKASWMGIRGVVDGDGRPLVQEQAQSGAGGRPQRMLLGYPVIIDQAFPAYNSGLGAHWAVLGDLSEAYVIRRVSNLAVVVNPYSSANNGQIEYIAWERADGNIQNRAAYSLAANAAA